MKNNKYLAFDYLHEIIEGKLVLKCIDLT